ELRPVGGTARAGARRDPRPARAGLLRPRPHHGAADLRTRPRRRGPGGRGTRAGRAGRCGGARRRGRGRGRGGGDLRPATRRPLARLPPRGGDGVGPRPLRGGAPRRGCHGRLLARAPAMRTTRTPVAVGAALALLAGQVGGAGTAAAVEPPVIDGPVPAAGGLDSGPLRPAGPCRTTAAVLDPSQPPASATATDLADAWIHGRGEGQVVAVIDTGVNPGPRLPRVRGAGDVVPGRDGTEDCD